MSRTDGLFAIAGAMTVVALLAVAALFVDPTKTKTVTVQVPERVVYETPTPDAHCDIKLVMHNYRVLQRAVRLAINGWRAAATEHLAKHYGAIHEDECSEQH